MTDFDEHDDGFGYFCDEDGMVEPSGPFAQVLFRASSRASDEPPAQNPVGYYEGTASDMIRSITEALSQRPHQQRQPHRDNDLVVAVERRERRERRPSIDSNNGSKNSSAKSSCSENLGSSFPSTGSVCSGTIANDFDRARSSSSSSGGAMAECDVESDDSLAEAPVWVVGQGAASGCCERCGVRLVYSAHHTSTGRVFSRSFPAPAVGGLFGSGSSLDGSAAAPSWHGSGSRRSSRSSADSMAWAAYTGGLPVDRPTAAALGGFRVVSRAAWGLFGLLPATWTEFEVVVTDGGAGAVHRAWRTLGDVQQLVEVTGLAARGAEAFPNASLAWELVRRRSRSAEMLHLIETRAALDVFFEHLLYELDTPTHLLNFVDDSTWRSDGSSGIVVPPSSSPSGRSGGMATGCDCLSQSAAAAASPGSGRLR